VNIDIRPHKDPGPTSPQPAVFARLSAEADVKLVRLRPHRAVRWVGWAIVGAIVAGVILAVAGVDPW
jgi:hypothetical protein